MGAYEFPELESYDGDFDNDGDVDGSDFVLFAFEYGYLDCNGGCFGDFDDDGDVDESDLKVFSENFGYTRLSRSIRR